MSIVSEAGGLNFQTLFYVVVTSNLSFLHSYFHFIEIGKRINRECAGFVLSYLTAELLQLLLHSKTFPVTSLCLRKRPPKAFLPGFICFFILHEAT